MSDARKQKQRALLVAKAIPREQLAKIRALIDQAIVDGMSFNEFRQQAQLVIRVGL